MRRLTLPAVALLATLAGCMGELGPGLANAGLTITAPADGSYVGGRLVRVSGEALTDAVRVNGVEVPVVDNRWATTVEASGEGPLQITAAALADEQQVGVLVDSIPPEVVVDSPTLPGFVEGDTLRVVGSVRDDSPVTLLADGERVDLGPDGSFEINRPVTPGAHRVRLQVQDEAGHVVFQPVAAIVGDLAPYDAPVEDAAALTLGPDAIGELNVGVNTILNSESFRQQMRDQLIGSYDDITIRSVEYGSADIQLATTDGGLSAHANIRDVNVSARACFRVLVRICKNATLHVNDLEVTADVGVVAAEGQLVTETRSADVAAHGFGYNVSGVPGFIEGLFEGRIRREIEKMGRNGVTDLLNDELPRILRDVSLDAAVDVLGSQVAFLGTFREVTLDPTGMHVRLDLEAWAEAPFEDRMAYGYLRMPHEGLTRADVGGASVQLSLESLNAISFAAWSGFDTYDAGELPGPSGGTLTVADLALATGSSRSLGELAPDDAQVVASLSLGLPPVIAQGPDGALRITAADARVHLAALTGDGSVDATTPLVTLSVYLSAPVTLGVEAGALVVTVGELEIAADALDAPAGFTRGERLDDLLQGLSRDFAGGLLAIDGVSLPSLAGFDLEAPAVETSGQRVRLDAALRYMGDGTI